jgi:hypothetical protein
MSLSKRRNDVSLLSLPSPNLSRKALMNSSLGAAASTPGFQFDHSCMLVGLDLATVCCEVSRLFLSTASFPLALCISLFSVSCTSGSDAAELELKPCGSSRDALLGGRDLRELPRPSPCMLRRFSRGPPFLYRLQIIVCLRNAMTAALRCTHLGIPKRN